MAATQNSGLSSNPEEDALKSSTLPSKTTSQKLPEAPSTGAGVNLAIAEIVLRSLADRMRGSVEADISKASSIAKDTGERTNVDGRSLLTSVGLYGAARLAGRSRAGLGLVAGGLLAKSLYERGKKVRERRRREK